MLHGAFWKTLLLQLGSWATIGAASLFSFFRLTVLLAEKTTHLPERWLSGRKRRFAKSVYGLYRTAGSNPVLSAFPFCFFAADCSPRPQGLSVGCRHNLIRQDRFEKQRAEMSRTTSDDVSLSIDVKSDHGEMELNQRAERVVDSLLHEAEAHGVREHSIANARVVDCGIKTLGGISAGEFLARTCMADLATLTTSRNADDSQSPETGMAVTVVTDHPLLACLASQYAGWPISVEDYFAMGSGPMRCLRGREKLFDLFPERTTESIAVGVLESSKLPTPTVVESMADDCGIDPKHLTLLVAPTRSLAGGFQIVARSIETALHKLHELNQDKEQLDLNKIMSAIGTAPLPPSANDDLTAIGRTNDAILFGAEVTLWIDAEDQVLSQLCPQIPSSASADYGEPFRAIYERVGGDFYAIDPMLFSPAVIRLISMNSKNTHTAGRLAPDLLARSFYDD